MKKITLLIEEFNATIGEIQKANIDKLTAIDEKIKIAIDFLQKFRILIKKDGFSSQKDEIYFFKVQKPKVQGQLEYYRRRKNFYLEFPLIPMKIKQSFLNKAINEIDIENSLNLEFIKYYKTDNTALDKYFFVRGNNQLDLFLNNTYCYEDPDFSTKHDYIVSKVITNGLLLKFYNKQIDLLERSTLAKVALHHNQILPSPKYTWTDSKTAFLELIKGLIAKGSINHGVVDMKELSVHCKARLGVDLGNYNQIYTQIKARKKDSTKFIDEVKISLQNLIDFENSNL